MRECLKRRRGSHSPMPMHRSDAFAGFESVRGGGRCGVVPASQHQELLVALASLIRAQRYEMALTILDNELGGGC